jgi:2-polyprenyl-6-methoxyphenol hydroxylase-like FAD-dependent oxidoreductase
MRSSFGFHRPMARIVVVGAGVAGLGTALSLGRAGHEVTVLERDATPLPADPHAAFEWDRRGAPQVRHSHAFLARLRNLLRDRHPDVLAQLLEAGATELRFMEGMPETIVDRSPRPGDDDLVALACRRTTFEWVLRRAALASPGVTLLDGVVVDGLVADSAGDLPRVTGVRLADGREVQGDLVVLAGGRRGDVPAWFAAIGARPVAEDDEDTGIIYWSRFYRLTGPAPSAEGPIGGDLGYLKLAVFQGDNGTFSVTFATGNEDAEMRVLADAARFDRAAAAMVPIAPWVALGVSEPITDVHPMAKLRNRIRRFVVDERPVALGVVAVGDAHTCTNPLYGRGCSLAMVHAELLADALDAHGTATEAFQLAFEAATAEAIEPWYRASVNQDRAQRAEAARQQAELAGEPPPVADDDPEQQQRQFMRSVLRDGLMPALRTDATVFRAFLRGFNLLEAPEALIQDQVVMAKVLEAWQSRDEREPDAPLGPDRATLLALWADLDPVA